MKYGHSVHISGALRTSTKQRRAEARDSRRLVLRRRDSAEESVQDPRVCADETLGAICASGMYWTQIHVSVHKVFLASSYRTHGRSTAHSERADTAPAPRAHEVDYRIARVLERGFERPPA